MKAYFRTASVGLSLWDLHLWRFFHSLLWLQLFLWGTWMQSESELKLRNALRCGFQSEQQHSAHWQEPGCYIWLPPNGPEVWMVNWWNWDLVPWRQTLFLFVRVPCNSVAWCNHSLMSCCIITNLSSEHLQDDKFIPVTRYCIFLGSWSTFPPLDQLWVHPVLVVSMLAEAEKEERKTIRGVDSGSVPELLGGGGAGVGGHFWGVSKYFYKIGKANLKSCEECVWLCWPFLFSKYKQLHC